jgi:hypothetical protein
MMPNHSFVSLSSSPTSPFRKESRGFSGSSPDTECSQLVANLIDLVQAVCTVCHKTKTLSLSGPPGFVCLTCRMSRQPRLTRRSDIRCRGCSQTPAEIGDDVSTVAVAFTCSRCLMREVDARPTCRRCLGEHWDAECEYTAAETKVVHAIRSQAKLVMRPTTMPRCLFDGHHAPDSPWSRECRVTVNSKVLDGDQNHAPAATASTAPKGTEAANRKSTTSETPETIKPSRRGRPRVSPESQRSRAAARQRAYRQRQKATEARGHV